MRRRAVLRGAALLGAGTVVGACGREMPSSEPWAPVEVTPGQPLPWINWAGNQYCLPAERVAPTSEDELVAVLRNARGTVRAVGSGHSFSPLVPTDGTLVATDLLTGLVGHDQARRTATVMAGTRLHALGPLLAGIDQAMPNLPDIDYPALAGALATSVHGTGSTFGSLSAYVSALTLATPAGDLLEVDAERQPEIFHAARTSLGALGVITRVTLANVAPFAVTERNGVAKLEDVLADIDRLTAEHRHFEFYALPYSSHCLTIATDLAEPADQPAGEDDPNGILALRALAERVGGIPLIGQPLYDYLLGQALSEGEAVVRTGPSFEVLPHIRLDRFREMEYTVPAAAGPECLREILATIARDRVPLFFPIEYRYVRGDDAWLSMFEGRDGCSISIHQFGDLDYRVPFAAIEPIFWKYEGRPHWGKIHTLGAAELGQRYQRHWRDFAEVRAALDPDGRMLNPHLRHVLGVPG